METRKETDRAPASELEELQALKSGVTSEAGLKDQEEAMRLLREGSAQEIQLFLEQRPGTKESKRRAQRESAQANRTQKRRRNNRQAKASRRKNRGRK